MRRRRRCRAGAWPAGSRTRSAVCASRVWTIGQPRARQAASSARDRRDRRLRAGVTSLPSEAPKPPGSMKSRCMSMTTSAVVAGVELVGEGRRGDAVERRHAASATAALARSRRRGAAHGAPPPMCAPIVRAVGAGGRRLEHDPAFAHHDDAVGELEQFVEVFADQQHRGAARRAPATMRAWISATAAKSRPNTGLAAISTLTSPASSRASTARCTLPPDRLRSARPRPAS